MSAIEASVVGSAQVAAKLRAFPDRIAARLAVVMRRLGIQLQGTVKRDKLSGEVLKNRTGNLRRSIGERLERGEDSVTARVGIFAGPTMHYGRAHEFGFTGPVPVRAHLREVAGKAHLVRAHTRNVTLPERSFLRSALREMAPDVLRAIEGATAAEVARV